MNLFDDLLGPKPQKAALSPVTTYLTDLELAQLKDLRVLLDSARTDQTEEISDSRLLKSLIHYCHWLKVSHRGERPDDLREQGVQK